MVSQAPTTNSGPIVIGNGEFLYVGTGIQVSGGGNAVETGINSTVTNNGTIAGVLGVVLDADSVLVNRPSGTIFGEQAGLGFSSTSSGQTIDNRGTIYASMIAISVGSNLTVINSGLIETGHGRLPLGMGQFLNAGVATGTGTTTIFNSGSIAAGRADGFSVFGFGTAVDNVTNTGTLIGKVSLGGGSDTLNTASGRVSGVIDMGAGADKVFGTAFGDTVLGGSGNDILIGNAGSDQLRGDAGVDTLNGGLGNDILSGGSESDTLIGGAGIDTLTGSAGSDFFVFNAGVVATNRDLITDFANITGNNDTFRLENAVMPKVGAPGALNPALFRAGSAALDANDFIVYNKTTGALFYDFNGNAAGGAVQLATLTNKPTLFASDFVVI
jgi:Ca2+-binding RTX toxin-like protein